MWRCQSRLHFLPLRSYMHNHINQASSTRNIPAAIFNKEESQLISTLLPIPKSHHFPPLWSRSYMQNLNGIPHYRNLTTLDEDVFYKIQSVRYAMATLSTWFDATDLR